jgi:uncharacterized protein (DUF1501 family)
MIRREFLKTSAAVGGALAISPYVLNANDFVPKVNSLSAYDFLKNDNIMIIVELSGGNDGLNTIIPVENDVYHQIRPNIRLLKEDCYRFDKTDLYMHPALCKDIYNDGMMGLMANGNLAVIEAVGYDEYTMSHFRGQDIWGSGILSTDPKVPLLEGWLGRYFASKLTNYPVEIPEHPLAINVGGVMPLALRSNKGDMGIALTNINRFYELGVGLTPKSGLSNELSNYGKEFNFISTVARQSEAYSNAIKAADTNGKNTVEYTGGGLVEKFRIIAKMISGGLKSKVYYVTQGGYDMHIQQMRDPFSGQHPNLLRELSLAISTFMVDATKQGFVDRVAGMTITEFGRRAYDNGSRGSDHGSASVQFMFGSSNYISSGRFGNPPKLDDLDENANIRHNFDFRRLYADFIESWFDGTKEDTETVFGEKIFPLGVLKKRISSVDEVEFNNNDYLNIYPNPSFGSGNISFTLKNSQQTSVSIYNIKGFEIASLHNGQLHNGEHTFNFNSLVNGSYIASIEVNGKRYVKPFIVAN